ncbi:head-tail joining protein [Cereibacter azotoformans]|uniref:Uncharacterized protein n=1 Tax=Cereibacter azotoformans TaxID=43057 RepID=A0A2T5K718_9RHOB|nr:hypothetical protein [Cereibacter azotoformans]MBO4169547.1 hypothetical protein [Cereibacter azotoformans]PTR18224.1 hypothetical protein C8J28_109184 [Cereibacter azotoformans]
MTPFADILADLAGVVASTFDSRTFVLTTTEGSELAVPGVFKKSHRDVQVGDYGAKSWVTVPVLDVSKAALGELGVTEPGEVLHGAAVTIEGTHYTVAEVRDGGLFARCLLSLDLDH